MKKYYHLKIIILILGVIISMGSLMVIHFFVFNPTEEIKIIDPLLIKNILYSYHCEVIEEKINDNYYYKTDSSCPYQLIYSIFSREEEREDYYHNLVMDVMINNQNYGDSGDVDIYTFGSYYSERTTDGTYYKSAILNKNTTLYISTKNENKENAITIRKALSYYYEPNLEYYKYLFIPGGSFLLMLLFIAKISIIEKNNLSN